MAPSALESTVCSLSDPVAFPTVPSESNLELNSHIASRLEGCSAKVPPMPAESGEKANLFATLGPEADGGIVLSGHTDVVPAEEADWVSAPFSMRQENRCRYGRGTGDMKRSVAAEELA